MKLKERVKAAADDEILHIGSGSSFFFIGTKEEYNRDIYLICDRFVKTAKKLMVANRNRLEFLLSRSTTSKDAVEQCKFRFRKAQKYIEDFTPFPEREIEEEYPRLQGDGVVLSIEGKESGAYWCRDEYLEALRKKGKKE